MNWNTLHANPVVGLFEAYSARFTVTHTLVSAAVLRVKLRIDANTLSVVLKLRRLLSRIKWTTRKVEIQISVAVEKASHEEAQILLWIRLDSTAYVRESHHRQRTPTSKQDKLAEEEGTRYTKCKCCNHTNKRDDDDDVRTCYAPAAIQEERLTNNGDDGGDDWFTPPSPSGVVPDGKITESANERSPKHFNETASLKQPCD